MLGAIAQALIGREKLSMDVRGDGIVIFEDGAYRVLWLDKDGNKLEITSTGVFVFEDRNGRLTEKVAKPASKTWQNILVKQGYPADYAAKVCNAWGSLDEEAKAPRYIS